MEEVMEEVPLGILFFKQKHVLIVSPCFLFGYFVTINATWALGFAHARLVERCRAKIRAKGKSKPRASLKISIPQSWLLRLNLNQLSMLHFSCAIYTIHGIVLFTHTEPSREIMGNHKSSKTEESCKGRLNILRAPILLLKTTTSSTPWTSRCKDQVCHRWQHPEFGKWWKCISTCGAQNAMDENESGITNEREAEMLRCLKRQLELHSFEPLSSPTKRPLWISWCSMIFCLVSVTPPLKALSTFTQRTCARATFSGCTAVTASKHPAVWC